MDTVLFTVALALILSAGSAPACWALRGRSAVTVGELAGLSALFGAAALSMVWWLAALLVDGRGATVVATIFALASAAAARVLWRRQRPRLDGGGPLLALLLPAALVLGWLAVHAPLQWDGFFVWEIKARAIVTEGGVPWHYLHDESRGWSHAGYPPLLPVLRAWTYTWLGGAHEGYAQLLGLLFPLAGAALLLGLAPRVGRLATGLACALLVLSPQAMLLAGGALSGYADFPLTVVYGGAMLYLALALGSNQPNDEQPADLRVAGLLAAVLPWSKQEGALLLLALVAVAALLLPRRWRQLHAVALPGLAVLFAWSAFVRLAAVRSPPVFAHPTLGLLWERLPLAGGIGRAALRLTLAPGSWGLLWLLFLFAAVASPRALAWRPTLALTLAVALPVALYLSVYLFSLWQPVTLHVDSSFARLLLQVLLPAVTLIAWKAAAVVDAARARARPAPSRASPRAPRRAGAAARIAR